MGEYDQIADGMKGDLLSLVGRLGDLYRPMVSKAPLENRQELKGAPSQGRNGGKVRTRRDA